MPWPEDAGMGVGTTGTWQPGPGWEGSGPWVDAVPQGSCSRLTMAGKASSRSRRHLLRDTETSKGWCTVTPDLWACLQVRGLPWRLALLGTVCQASRSPREASLGSGLCLLVSCLTGDGARQWNSPTVLQDVFSGVWPAQQGPGLWNTQGPEARRIGIGWGAL